MDHDREAASERAQILARLATLQRLQDEMSKSNRSEMLASIQKMMEADRELLRKLAADDRTGQDASNDSENEKRA